MKSTMKFLLASMAGAGMYMAYEKYFPKMKKTMNNVKNEASNKLQNM